MSVPPPRLSVARYRVPCGPKLGMNASTVPSSLTVHSTGPVPRSFLQPVPTHTPAMLFRSAISTAGGSDDAVLVRGAGSTDSRPEGPLWQADVREMSRRPRKGCPQWCDPIHVGDRHPALTGSHGLRALQSHFQPTTLFAA